MTKRMERKDVIAKICIAITDDLMGNGTMLCDFEDDYNFLYNRINRYGWYSLKICELLTIYCYIIGDQPIEIID